MWSPAKPTQASRAPFGLTPEGRAVDVFTLTNDAGFELKALGWGGAITWIDAPDRDERVNGNVVLAYPDLDGYVSDRYYVGTLIGRYSNRIAGGRFSLGGRTHALPVNDGPNHLHGGPRGFHKQVWDAEAFTDGGAAGLALRRTSPAGEEGYPGTLAVEVTYRWESPATLDIAYRASCDEPTPVSLTHHGYYNLAGRGTILDHVLQIDADRFTPADDGLVPTGERTPVAGTPFDFREPRPIDGPYDLNFVLRPERGLRRAAHVFEPLSGRTLTVFTTEPALQLYTGNALGAFGTHAGFCLEPQQFPDAPNRAEFPSPILAPGREYRSRTRLVFGAEKGR